MMHCFPFWCRLPAEGQGTETAQSITQARMRGSGALSGKTAQMSLGDKFSQSRTRVTVVGQNPARSQNCVVSERKGRQGVGDLLGQSTQFSRGTLGRSSWWGLRNFSKEDSAGNRRHWQKNLRSFLVEDKIPLQELLGKIAQS